MTRFAASLRDWKTDRFTETLKGEVTGMKSGALPLAQCAVKGGLVDDSSLVIIVLGTDEDEHALNISVGIFFTEIVINCGCGDDPMEETAYCEIGITIDKETAEAQFSVRPV